MARLLKLKHLSTYAGPRVKGEVVRKNEVIKVDDDRADDILENASIDLNGEPTCPFVEIDKLGDKDKVAHDLTTKVESAEATPGTTPQRTRTSRPAVASKPAAGTENQS